MKSEVKRDFFDKNFDDATVVKLSIFRQYIREWLPVFMTRRKIGSKVNSIHIYAFFAGPGGDSDGNPGSPLIIVDELKRYCAANEDLKSDVDVRMIFNDINEQFIEKLKPAVKEIACEKSCCKAEFSSLPFAEALSRHLITMHSSNSAHLVIMDQFGIKEVTPDVVQELAGCKNTDILFFLSTGFIHRFIETPEIGGKFNFSATDLKNREYNVIHRFLCDYYKKSIGDESYFLAPFSIKKGSNIYGVVFGTRHLLGLEKFLKVCWALDSKTGEANYNIDDDSIWNGQLSLFEERNAFKKINLFGRELLEYISSKNPNNVELNKFCLSKGFPPNKAREILIALQERGELIVWDIENNRQARRGAFYLGWDNCKTGVEKARFAMEK